MKKSFTIIISALMLITMMAPRVVWGQSNYDLVAELDMTTKAISVSAYNTSSDYGNGWTIVYGANNNKGWEYFKMGGKSTTLSLSLIHI